MAKDTQPSDSRIATYTRLSSDTKPTASNGVQNGETLYEVDTGKVYVFHSGQWWVV